MTGVLAIVAFLALILLVVILVHELGHFLVARVSGSRSRVLHGFGRGSGRAAGELEYGIGRSPLGAT